VAHRAGAVRRVDHEACRGRAFFVHAAVALFTALTVSHRAPARTLEDALISTFPGQLREDGEGLASVLGRTVAASFPVTGASSAYAYRFDPASDSFRRLSIPLGPVFSERAVTLGSHKLSLGVNYLLVDYDTINGHDLHALVSNDPRDGGDHITVCSAGLGCEAVEGQARIDLEAQIVTLAATYGVTQDLDVGFLLPLVRTSLHVATQFIGPDPRISSAPTNFFATLPASEASTGVGDVLLRGKYRLARAAPVDLAAGLTVSLPTGDPANFHGTGDTQVGAAVYASRCYLERIEPHLNLSFVLNTDKFDRSQVRYSAGADVRVFDWLTLNNDFLGRSDVAQPDTIDQPVFVQIERTDVFAFSTGLKAAPWPHVVLFFNALVPLNEEDVRADHVLAAGVEAIF
jgi:hypothetical protein